MRRYLAIAAGALLALVAAFLGGRYSAPARVETRTEWKEKVVTVTEWKDRVVTQKGPERIRVVTREIPGGERIVEKVIERGPSTTTTDTTGQAHSQTDQSSATVSVKEAGRPGWSVGVSGQWAGAPSSAVPDRLGLELDRRLFGTIWLGVRASSRGTSDPQLGLALRMEF